MFGFQLVNSITRLSGLTSLLTAVHLLSSTQVAALSESNCGSIEIVKITMSKDNKYKADVKFVLGEEIKEDQSAQLTLQYLPSEKSKKLKIQQKLSKYDSIPTDSTELKDLKLDKNKYFIIALSIKETDDSTTKVIATKLFKIKSLPKKDDKSREVTLDDKDTSDDLVFANSGDKASKDSDEDEDEDEGFWKNTYNKMCRNKVATAIIVASVLIFIAILILGCCIAVRRR